MLFPFLALIYPALTGLFAVRTVTTVATIVIPTGLLIAKDQLKKDLDLGLSPEVDELVRVEFVREGAEERGQKLTEQQIQLAKGQERRPVLTPFVYTDAMFKEAGFSDKYRKKFVGRYLLTGAEYMQLASEMRRTMLTNEEDVDEVRFLKDVAAKAGVTYEELCDATSVPTPTSVGALRVLSERRFADPAQLEKLKQNAS